ncbi:MAG: GNAT family acetyltransferase [Alcaligenes aquatilis]
MKIRPYQTQDELAVVALWENCGLIRPWNDPYKDIARKLTEQPELFLVGTETDKVIATAMIGFDGHRGWVYYLAVDPEFRQMSYGKALMREAERLLIARGCQKVNLLIRSTNKQVIDFYLSLGYVQDDVISLGRRIIEDLPSQEG